MTKTLNDLGKLKRELVVEIPFEEIKPSYDEVFSELKSVTLRGFRPGKFPKGWLMKRFSEKMTVEAREQVIPRYFNQVVEDMKLHPATQAKISDLSFAAKKPMNFKLTFEVQPDLEPVDYNKLQLEMRESVLLAGEIEEKIAEMRNSHRTHENKPEDSAAEEGDRVTYDLTRTIGEETGEEKDLELELNEFCSQKFKENITGMRSGERKAFSFEITEDYMREHVGETASFELTLKKVERTILPEMNADFFRRFDNSENEEEFRRFVTRKLEERKANESRFSHHQELKKQLLECYDEFELPEELIENQKKIMEEKRRKSETEDDEAKPGESEEEELERYEKQLRTEYILKNIAIAESLQPDEEKVAQRFASMAQLWGVHPNEFFDSALGPRFYRQIYQQISEEQVLDFIIDRLSGAPAA